MKIIVYDVAAVSGGALTILLNYYYKSILDLDNKYVFIISLPSLKSTSNVRVLNFPKIKKSRFHRIYFEFFKAHKIVKDENPDRIISLQNLIIPRIKNKQTIFIYQAIPFSDLKFNILTDFNLWFYRYIYKWILFRSIKLADRISVQTNWMKQLIVGLGLSSDTSIIVEKPSLISIQDRNIINDNVKMKTFIYPAAGETYKNHMIIIRALTILKSEKQNDYRFIFTVNGRENKYTRLLYNEARKLKLPIDFVGNLDREKIYEILSSSYLVYPSLIESLGLPLLEAMQLKRFIIAIDEPYAIEVLNNYNNAFFFKRDDAKQLSNLIQSFIEN